MTVGLDRHLILQGHVCVCVYVGGHVSSNDMEKPQKRNQISSSKCPVSTQMISDLNFTFFRYTKRMDTRTFIRAQTQNNNTQIQYYNDKLLKC